MVSGDQAAGHGLRQTRFRPLRWAVTARIIIPGRLARAGVASRHPVAYAGVKFLEAVHRADGEPLVVRPEG